MQAYEQMKNTYLNHYVAQQRLNLNDRIVIVVAVTDFLLALWCYWLSCFTLHMKLRSGTIFRNKLCILWFEVQFNEIFCPTYLLVPVFFVITSSSLLRHHLVVTFEVRNKNLQCHLVNLNRFDDTANPIRYYAEKYNSFIFRYIYDSLKI